MERYLEISKDFNDINEYALDILIDRLYDLGIEGIEIKSPLSSREIDGDYFDVKILDKKPTEIKAYIKETEYIKYKDQIDKVLIKYTVAMVEDEEKWLLAYQKYFKVFKPGKRFVIVPEWESYNEKDNELIIKINPNMAFGTGTHPTTKNVLVLMEELDFKNKEIVDIGTGSGILTIGAILLGAKNILVVDNDEKAIEVARANLKEYSNINYKVNDLLKGIDKKFDIILANIVADILIDLSADVNENLKDDSFIIISGIIEEKWPKVALSFKKQGLVLVKILEEKGWITALYKK